MRGAHVAPRCIFGAQTRELMLLRSTQETAAPKGRQRASPITRGRTLSWGLLGLGDSVAQQSVWTHSGLIGLRTHSLDSPSDCCATEGIEQRACHAQIVNNALAKRTPRAVLGVALAPMRRRRARDADIVRSHRIPSSAAPESKTACVADRSVTHAALGSFRLLLYRKVVARRSARLTQDS